jgi:hypothetical protein
MRRNKIMAKEQIASEEKTTKKRKPENESAKRHASGSGAEVSGLASLQQLVGNRAVQRLLAQRSSDSPTELDDETAGRINRERGGGQPLDTALQKQTSAAMGHDFSGVRVHTSPEADDLSRQLGAKAFTTGQDIFFREGAYDPHSSGGQELLAHELTHAVQQSSGAVGGGGRMTVNPPGDVYEHEADAVAKTVAGAGAGAEVQRQVVPEEEEEEEPVQTQIEEEEEEPIQMQPMEEEEEEVMA